MSFYSSEELKNPVLKKYWWWGLVNVPFDVNEMTGQCEKYSKEMYKAFPELILCRGIVHFSKENCAPGKQSQPHWWLKTTKGKIIDPTFKQFLQFGGVERWDEINEKDIDLNSKTNKCMNCGVYFVGLPDNICSSSCEAEFTAWQKG